VAPPVPRAPGGATSARWLVAAALILTTGCAGTPSAPPSPELPRVEAGDLVRRWEDEWRAFPGLRAAVDLTVTRRGRAQRSAGVLLLSPTHLRFEVVTPLGLPALIVTAGPEQLLVWSATERRAWTGRPTPESLGRWLGVPLPPASLIRLLVGQVPPPSDPASARFEERGGRHLVFDRESVRHRVWVTAEGYPVRLQLDGARSVTAKFERTPTGGFLALSIEVPDQKLEAQIRYLFAESVAPPREAFEVRLPPGVRVEQAD